MNFEMNQFAVLNSNTKDFDYAKDYPTIADLLIKQKVSNNDIKTVHHRRDLDSMG